MNLTYQDPTVGTIRTSTLKDCAMIARDMCEQDKIEMWCFDRSSPIEDTINSYKKSVVCMTIVHEEPIAMFGIMPVNMSSGILWMLTTDGLRDGKFGRPFVRNCKRWFNEMLEMYPLLYGMVDTRNKESIRWLTYLGTEWGEDILCGIDKVPFKPFKFLKG